MTTAGTNGTDVISQGGPVMLHLTTALLSGRVAGPKCGQ